jgi:peptide/nickel transport system ATP-binding protein
VSARPDGVAEAALRVEDLRVGFDTRDGLVQAVDGISYAVAPGRTLGIVGESGSGKTVAAMTAMGLTRGPRTRVSGRVLLDGEDLLAASPARLQALRGDALAMVFQDPLSALHPLLRVGDQIEEAVRAHRDVPRSVARARAVELLELVAISNAARRIDAYPHELSGGMRQRAMIAMALANDPRVLIADEPTTALDVTVQAQILALLRRLRDELGMAMVLITHDLGVVAETADEIAVMYAGRIVEQAPAAELFAHPQHPYTWGLLRSVPRLDAPAGAELVPIPGRPPSLIDPPPGCRFHPRCPYVRERHRTVDPALEPLAARPEHRVACLLPEAERGEIWAGLTGAAASSPTASESSSPTSAAGPASEERPA